MTPIPTELRELLHRIRQRYCRHEFAIDDLRTTGEPDDSDRRVRWPCSKCGKAFYANYGLAISPKHGPTFRRREVQP